MHGSTLFLFAICGNVNHEVPGENKNALPIVIFIETEWAEKQNLACFLLSSAVVLPCHVDCRTHYTEWASST